MSRPAGWIVLACLAIAGGLRATPIQPQEPEPVILMEDGGEEDRDLASVPEPATYALLGAGLIAVALLRRRTA